MRPWGTRVLLAFTIVALAATLVIHVSPWITKGFGYSTDGYNGAMWGLGARGAIRSATVWVASIPAATATPTTLPSWCGRRR